MSNHLFLLRELVKRDFQSRYAGSLLGFFWSFVQPVFLLGLYTFVFSTVMQLSLLGERTGSFGLFLFAGLVPWLAFQEGAQRSATVITENAMLVKKLTFPSEILVASSVVAALLHQAIAGGLFVVVLAVLGELAPLALPWLFLALPLQMALTLGLGLLLAAVQVFVRDTAQVLGMVFTAWFFMTPIVYPLSMVPERYRVWIELNPMTTLVGIYRKALFGPAAPEPIPGLLPLVLLAVSAFAVGWVVFRRLKPTFVDEL